MVWKFGIHEWVVFATWMRYKKFKIYMYVIQSTKYKARNRKCNVSRVKTQRLFDKQKDVQIGFSYNVREILCIWWWWWFPQFDILYKFDTFSIRVLVMVLNVLFLVLLLIRLHPVWCVPLDVRQTSMQCYTNKKYVRCMYSIVFFVVLVAFFDIPFRSKFSVKPDMIVFDKFSIKIVSLFFYLSSDYIQIYIWICNKKVSEFLFLSTIEIYISPFP